MIKFRRFHIYPALAVALATCIFLSFNIHSRHGKSWKSEIYADKAGYYIFLPATFIYGFNTLDFPGKIDSITGHGFKIDTGKNKVVTKYPAGVSILQSPFFLATHALAKPLGYENDGFSLIYYKMVNIAAISYLIAGMFMLFLFLRSRFSIKGSVLTLFILLAGTNLFYYSLNDTGMSHVYSFFAFSGLFLFAHRTSKGTGKNFINLFLVGLFMGLIIAVRPVNFLIILFIFLYYSQAIARFIINTKPIVSIRSLLTLIVPAIFLMIPQLIYNLYLSGSLLYYSYGNESFSNWYQPKIWQIWFSTNNGLFTYNPVLIIAIIGASIMIFRKEYSGWLILLFFLFITYVFSSWWSWWYGCSYGSRVYVEYFVLLSIPIGYSLEKTYTIRNRFLRISVFSLILILCLYNLNLIYKFPNCWFWGNWDWEALFRLMIGKHPLSKGFNLYLI